MAITLMRLSVAERLALTAVVRKLDTPLVALHTADLAQIYSRCGFLQASKLEHGFLSALFEEALLRKVIKPAIAVPWRLDQIESKNSGSNGTAFLDRAIDDLIESARSGGHGVDGLELLAPVMYGYDLKSDGLDVFNDILRKDAAQAVKRALERKGISDELVCKAYSRQVPESIRRLQPIFDISVEIESSPNENINALDAANTKSANASIVEKRGQNTAHSGVYIAIPLAIALGYLLGKYF
jgi:hypothetical protein